METCCSMHGTGRMQWPSPAATLMMNSIIIIIIINILDQCSALIMQFCYDRAFNLHKDKFIFNNNNILVTNR